MPIVTYISIIILNVNRLNAPTFELLGSQKKKRKRKGMRKFFKRLQLKISPTWKRKQSIKSKRHKESYAG